MSQLVTSVLYANIFSFSIGIILPLGITYCYEVIVTFSNTPHGVGWGKIGAKNSEIKDQIVPEIGVYLILS